jgi:hypothetical protein
VIATGVMPRLVQLLGPGSASEEREAAIGALRNLAAVGKDGPGSQIYAAIIAAGAISPLVQLLVRDSPEGVQVAAAGLLTKLAASNARHRLAIVDAGAIPRLERLVQRGTGASDSVQSAVCSALGALQCFCVV